MAESLEEKRRRLDQEMNIFRGAAPEQQRQFVGIEKGLKGKYTEAAEIPGVTDDSPYAPVTVKGSTGQTFQILVPRIQEGESLEGFEYRQQQAKRLAAPLEVAGDYIGKIAKERDLPLEEAPMEAARTVQAEIDMLEKLQEQMARLPKNDRNKEMRQYQALELMRARALKSSLLKYFEAQHRLVPDGKGGLVMYVDTQGRPAFPEDRSAKRDDSL